MKSGPRRVFRYSSMHEKEIPNGSIRRRMELHREPHLPDPKGYRPPRTPTLRQILNAIFYYLRAAASSGACSRTTSLEVAHPLALLQNLAPREEGTSGRGSTGPSFLRTPTRGSPEAGSPEPSAGVVDSQGRSRVQR